MHSHGVCITFSTFFFSVFTFRSAEYIQRRKEPLRLQAKYSLIIQQQKMTNPITTKNKQSFVAMTVGHTMSTIINHSSYKNPIKFTLPKFHKLSANDSIFVCSDHLLSPTASIQIPIFDRYFEHEFPQLESQWPAQGLLSYIHSGIRMDDKARHVYHSPNLKLLQFRLKTENATPFNGVV